jgi:hypothetical protein
MSELKTPADQTIAALQAISPFAPAYGGATRPGSLFALCFDRPACAQDELAQNAGGVFRSRSGSGHCAIHRHILHRGTVAGDDTHPSASLAL